MNPTLREIIIFFGKSINKFPWLEFQIVKIKFWLSGLKRDFEENHKNNFHVSVTHINIVVIDNHIIMEKKYRTLSFGILDDVCWTRLGSHGPFHLQVASDLSDLPKVLDEIATIYTPEHDHDSHWDHDEFDSHRDDILKSLLDDNYWVFNQFEKYYSIAFALDFTTFKVYSKGCDPGRMDWHVCPTNK